MSCKASFGAAPGSIYSAEMAEPDGVVCPVDLLVFAWCAGLVSFPYQPLAYKMCGREHFRCWPCQPVAWVFYFLILATFVSLAHTRRPTIGAGPFRPFFARSLLAYFSAFLSFFLSFSFGFSRKRGGVEPRQPTHRVVGLAKFHFRVIVFSSANDLRYTRCLVNFVQFRAVFLLGKKKAISSWLECGRGNLLSRAPVGPFFGGSYGDEPSDEGFNSLQKKRPLQRREQPAR